MTLSRRSMDDDFGTPSANDAQARVEKSMNETQKRIEKSFELVKQQYNRPLGSKPVPPEVEFSEYVANATTPEARQQHFYGLAAQWREQGYTFDEAVQMALDYENRNERRLNEGRI